MQVRWTMAAAEDLENIANFLFEKTPENATRLIREVYESALTLRNFPNCGRPGKKEGTRELVLSPLRYIIVYQISGDAPYVHGAQDRPQQLLGFLSSVLELRLLRLTAQECGHVQVVLRNFVRGLADILRHLMDNVGRRGLHR
jgi:toxin ParE1/3/4